MYFNCKLKINEKNYNYTMHEIIAQNNKEKSMLYKLLKKKAIEVQAYMVISIFFINKSIHNIKKLSLDSYIYIFKFYLKTELKSVSDM